MNAYLKKFYGWLDDRVQLEDLVQFLGKKAPTPTGGSSKEFCAMGESLTQRRRVEDESLRVVNSFSQGGIMTVPGE